MDVQQDNAARNTATVARLPNTAAEVRLWCTLVPVLVDMGLARPVMVAAVVQVVQRDHAVPPMDFVETLQRIVQAAMVTATVILPDVELGFVVPDMDIAVLLLITALSPSSWLTSSPPHSKANSKAKQDITTKPWPARISVHAALVVLVH